MFDDPNLVASAGLVPALRLAESAGLYDLLNELTVPPPNATAKAACDVLDANPRAQPIPPDQHDVANANDAKPTARGHHESRSTGATELG